MLSIHYFLSTFCLTLKALSASGLRALRYAREVEGVGQVVALDNDKGNFLVTVISKSYFRMFLVKNKTKVKKSCKKSKVYEIVRLSVIHINGYLYAHTSYMHEELTVVSDHKALYFHKVFNKWILEYCQCLTVGTTPNLIRKVPLPCTGRGS